MHREAVLNGLYSWGAKAPIFESIRPKRYNPDISSHYDMNKALRAHANAYSLNWSLLEREYKQ